MATIPRCYLGIDAGATKTHALIAEETGHVLGTGASGGGNWEGVGLEGAYAAYAEALGQALAEAGLRRADLAAAGYALAGLDFPSDEGRLAPIVARLGVPGPRMLVNDAYAALRAGARRGYGVAVIAGTGSAVAGIGRDGAQLRTFAEGQGAGDVGGAGDFVWLAVRAIAQAHTGRGMATDLTARLLEAADCATPVALIEAIHRGACSPVSAAHAPLVFAAAEAGDAVAQGIIRYVGGELGANAAAIAHRLGLAAEPFELVLAGGVFRAESALLMEAMLAPLRAVAPGVEPMRLDTAPVAGSVLLAMDAAGCPAEAAVHDRLAAETASILGR